jgi:alkylhydroperoxidase/carboxymuconolactone decarboxylase family protein YurZ
MARLPELDATTASPPIAKALRAQEATFGYPLNATKIMGHCPEVTQAATALGGAIDREGNIEPKLRYLLYVRVAGVNGCPF